LKITLYDRESGREFLVSQVVESHGHNPWTGQPLSREYNALLGDGLVDVETAGTALVGALDRITGMAAELRIEPETILGPLRERLERVNATPTGSAA
jgi:hypothetical protein